MTNERTEKLLRFTRLPLFAASLLQQLERYTEEFVRQVYAADLPLLKNLRHLSEEERFLFSRKLNQEFLTNLSANQAAAHIEAVTTRWMADQFENIGRLDLDAQDVMLINYVRSKTLKSFIPSYTTDLALAAELHSEIDDLAFCYNARSTEDYLQVLRKRIEEEAHFSRNIVETSPGIVFIFDILAQRELYINGRVQAVTGYTPEEVLAMNDLTLSLTHPEDLPVLDALLQKVMSEKEGKIHHADYRLKNKEDIYQWLRCYAVVYRRNAKGEATQLLGMAYDVGQEKETADALVKRERQLLEAQAIGKIGSFEWDIVNDISYSTPELRKIFEADHRQTLEEMMEKVHPDDAGKIRAALNEAFQTGNYACEYRYRAPSGEKVLDSRGVVSFDAAHRPLTLTGTLQDVTERKRIEESLLKNTLELQRSNTQLQEFASVASHDLKEPLRKIGMFSNIIMTSDWDDLPERTKTNIQKISDSAHRMQKLIEGILSYSSFSLAGSKEPCSLEDLYHEALQNLEYKIAETGASITSDGLPRASVNPFQFQQLLQNLIGNALKFSKKLEPPVVQLTHRYLPGEAVRRPGLQKAARYLEIRVTDNGIGFSPQAAEKIFGLFQRLHGRSDYEGSGLGLAICKRIAENHGGSLSATSELGAGAVFTILLPAETE
jgi:PAS domain S-box-containing protein